MKYSGAKSAWAKWKKLLWVRRSLKNKKILSYQLLHSMLPIREIGHMEQDNQSAFQFHGKWQDFFKIAIVNLLLTIITLGIYRFWATSREREYLWGQTQFIDERLEWTGTGKELFLGFVIVAVIFLIPFALLYTIAGFIGPGFQIILYLIGLVFAFYFFGLAKYRALRYRLSRTYWHGIRGGSDDKGFGFGFSYMVKTAAGYIPLGLGNPWSTCELWNERWGKMSFGNNVFESHASYSNVFGTYILSYILFPFSWVYQARLRRTLIGALRLEKLEFGFTASTFDWIGLFLVDILIVLATFGIGIAILPYRHWQFFIEHLEAYGEVDLDALTQSNTERSKHGEGLLDAFDVGAV